MEFDVLSWKYEFDEWIKVLQSDPVELIHSEDNSSDYEMLCKHLFKLKNGRYAVIVEDGCSCYEPCDASIELFPDLESAEQSYNKIFR